VLAMTQWDKVELMRLLKSDVDAAIKSDRLKPNDAMKLLADYERLLQEYTYLSFNGAKLPPPPSNCLPLSYRRPLPERTPRRIQFSVRPCISTYSSPF